MGLIGVPEITLIVPTLQRGNASQDAPRPGCRSTLCVGMISSAGFVTVIESAAILSLTTSSK